MHFDNKSRNNDSRRKTRKSKMATKVDDSGDKVSSTSDEIEAKRRKIDDKEHNETIAQPLKNLRGFKMVKILSESTHSKTMFVHGKFEGSDDQAVVLLEKKPFREQTVSSVISSDTHLDLEMHNDVYGVYEGFPKQEDNGNYQHELCCLLIL